jgi:integrase
VANLHPDPRKDRPALKMVLQGIGRARGVTGANKKRPRQPLTVSTAMYILQLLDLTKFDHLLFWAILSVALAGFMRLGETLSTDPSRQLRWRDIEFVSTTHARLTLPGSKADAVRCGVQVNIFGSGGAACPVQALLALRRAQLNETNEAAFVFADQSGAQVHKDRWFVTRMRTLLTRVETRLKIGIRPELFSGHSLRQGAATSAWLRGVPEAAIKAWGRWRSDCYVKYIHIPAASLRRYANKVFSASAADVASDAARLNTQQPPDFIDM